jgi:hypothetical protein
MLPDVEKRILDEVLGGGRRHAAGAQVPEQAAVMPIKKGPEGLPIAVPNPLGEGRFSRWLLQGEG